MKPYYEEAGIQIFHGDCREILPQIPRYSVDLAIADPPYNCGLEYLSYNDSRTEQEYSSWCSEWFTLLRGVCSRTIIFPGHGNLPMWFRDNPPSAVGCWYKPGNGSSSIIGWEEWEPWLYWIGNKGMLGGSTVLTARTGLEDGNAIGHPCPKPIKLLERILLKCKSAAVLDPFMGSGTSLVAAKNLGRKAIGIELEERYCEIAANRLRQSVLNFEEVSA